MSWKKLLGIEAAKTVVKPMTVRETEKAFWNAATYNKHKEIPNEKEIEESIMKALKDGALVNVRIDSMPFSGGTVLHYFVKKQNLKRVKELLALGADPNIPNMSGFLPILDSRSNDIFKVLVEGGADLTKLMGPNPNAQVTPLHYMSWPGFNREVLETYLREGVDYIGCYDKETVLNVAIKGVYTGKDNDGKSIFEPVRYAIESFAEAGVPVSQAQRAAYAPLDERCKKAEALWQSWQASGCDVAQIDYPTAMLFSNIGKLDALLKSDCWQGHNAQLAGLCAQFSPALFERFCTHRPALIRTIATPQTVIEGWSAALDMSPAQPIRSIA